MEIWKDINGYEGIYQVSNFGRVKSLKFNKEKILKGSINKAGYHHVSLFKDNKITFKNIHILVAESFLNHKSFGKELVVNHIDFNKLNNNLNNLEITTFRDNANKKHIKSSSRYVGVSWNNKKNKWVCQISFKNKQMHLGYFKNEYDAYLAYEKKLKEFSKNV